MKITLDLRTVADNTLYTIGAALYAELEANDQAVTRTMFQEVVLEVDCRSLDSTDLRSAFEEIAGKCP